MAYQNRDKLSRVPSLNCLDTYLDSILTVVYDSAQSSRDGGNSIIFSSTNPQVCLALNWKQPNYGVFFKTYAGYKLDRKYTEQDSRCSSIKEAIKFAKSGNLLGIFCLDLPLLVLFRLTIAARPGADSNHQGVRPYFGCLRGAWGGLW